LEAGTSNLFIYWRNEKGEEELVTPKADDLILHGVTRDSVIGLAEEMNRFPVI
jgi:branched-chain amino acid aminotransferase